MDSRHCSHRSLSGLRSEARRVARAAALATLFLAPLLATPARADDAAAAEALFLEAKELMKVGKFAEACPKLEASFKLDKAVGTLMNVADCHEKSGKIASAWAEWGTASDWLKREGDKRSAYAAERQSGLAPRLPRLKIAVAAPFPGLDIWRGESKLDTGAYNTALPVDPGTQVVTVRRGTQVLKEEKVDAKEGETTALPLDLEAIDKANPPPPPPPATASGTPSTPPIPPATKQGTSSQKVAGFVVGGVGIVAVLVAAGLEIAAMSQVSKAEEPDGCVNNFCGPQGYDAVGRAGTFADVGQWVGIAGIVTAGIGLTLVLTAPSSSQRASAPPAKRAWASPWVGPSAGGIAVSGKL